MSEPERHRRLAELVPWYVNGTLEREEHDLVAEHVSTCRECQDAVAQCQTLATAVQSTRVAASTPAPDRLERLLATIDALEDTATPQAGWRARWHAGMEWLRDLIQLTPGPVRWGLAVQAALLIAVLGAAVWSGALSPQAPYHTLAQDTTRPGRQALIHVVFAEDISEREMRTLLGRIQGKIVDGPSAVGLYTVAVPASAPDQVAPVLTMLRADPKVRLAEPVSRR